MDLKDLGPVLVVDNLTRVRKTAAVQQFDGLGCLRKTMNEEGFKWEIFAERRRREGDISLSQEAKKVEMPHTCHEDESAAKPKLFNASKHPAPSMNQYKTHIRLKAPLILWDSFNSHIKILGGSGRSRALESNKAASLLSSSTVDLAATRLSSPIKQPLHYRHLPRTPMVFLPFLSILLVSTYFVHPSHSQALDIDLGNNPVRCVGPPPHVGYFAWEWGPARTGAIANKGHRDYGSLLSLCTSPEVRWSYRGLIKHCKLSCLNWSPPADYIPVEPFIHALTGYHEIQRYILRITEKILVCSPDAIDSNYPWPDPTEGYREWFPTLSSLCPERADHFYYRPNPFGLGCKCMNDNEPPSCPTDNALWLVHEGLAVEGNVIPGIHHRTRIAPGELSAYHQIQQAFIPKCEQHCLCSPNEEKDQAIRDLAKVSSRLNAIFPGWFPFPAEFAGSSADAQGGPDHTSDPGQGECQGNQQCGSGRQCQLRPVSSNVVLGVSAKTIYQTACVAIGLSMRHKRPGALGGRDLDQNQHISGEGAQPDTVDWPCACNMTYVSDGCCGADDGMIHEDLKLKRGTLMEWK